jgi:branched-chain amino acid transport system ATP-binding protein
VTAPVAASTRVEAPARPTAPGPVATPASAPLLAVRGLTRRFGGFTAVDGVSFELARGEILGLIGPNGSGKSTTFNVIAGLHLPSAGSIRLEGEEIGGLSPSVICRKGLARTFQIPRPFRKLGLRENATLAAFYGAPRPIDHAEAEHRAVEALELIGLPHHRDVGVAGLGAAGLKKLEMARALATQPKVLLADESLGGLDETEMAQAAQMLRRIRDERGVSIIWVEHIMGVLMRVIDRCVVLDHGQLIAEGLPSAVTRDPRVIEVYLGTDAREVQDELAARAPR